MTAIMLNERIKNIPLPRYMVGRPISPKGFPVPWFVTWLDDKGQEVPPGEGTPDFRVITGKKVFEAHNRKLCWICGQPRGSFLAFTIGPMCAINRVSSEPPQHRDCAIYAAQACPFLTQPKMRRNEAGLPGERHVMDGFIARNPGAVGVWITKNYAVRKVKDAVGIGLMFHLGAPQEVLWYANSRKATLAEVQHSIQTGLPLLGQQYSQPGGGGPKQLERDYKAMMPFLPAE